MKVCGVGHLPVAHAASEPCPACYWREKFQELQRAFGDLRGSVHPAADDDRKTGHKLQEEDD